MSFFLKIKKSPKSSKNDRKSPLTKSTMAFESSNAGTNTMTEESVDIASADDIVTDQLPNTPLTPPMNSPTVLISRLTLDSSNNDTSSVTPRSCRPPPLSLATPRKDSLTVDCGSVSSSHSLDDLRSCSSKGSLDGGIISPLSRPSSPMLSAIREAVDSVSNMEDFETIEKIGAGFFAEVFKVLHIPTNQIMVLKVNKRLTSAKTLREVELLKKLSHPNILHYLGACVYNGQLHPLTEFVNGGTLDTLIQDTGRDFPAHLRVQLSLDLANGMAYLHNNGMLHRDLNSHNCFLRKNGKKYTAVVADFGLATRNPKVLKSLERTQSIVGTPYWMAPEVLNGKSYNESADIFSYGIILCEMISRKDADPEEIPRNSKDFSLDETEFLNLPEVIQSGCPQKYIDLACSCTKFLPLERPSFSELVIRLTDLSSILNSGRETRSESLPPTPDRRLSWHFTKFNDPETLSLEQTTI